MKDKLSDEGFTELVEKTLLQAARTSSDRRREHLASLLASSLAPDAIEHAETTHLLRILSELTDVEVIFLRYEVRMDREFLEQHRRILAPDSVGAAHTHSRALEKSYIQHFVMLGTA
jgi:hypothetical protein